LLVLVAAMAAAVSFGCGGGSPADPAPPLGSAAEAALGRRVFLEQCQGCHALGPIGARKPAGGDLANYSMTRKQVRSFARIMPTPRKLTAAELTAVSAYVSAVQARADRDGRRREGRSRSARD
jgi:mono/diheme cytochrome c family protein